MNNHLVLTSRGVVSNPKCVHGYMLHEWRLDMINMIVKGWDNTWFTRTFKPDFNLMHWKLTLLHHCSQLLKHWGANGRKFGWRPYIVNINNYGRVYVGKFCFNLVINYTCMNALKSKMKKLVKKQMWKKARVTYCNILLKPP